MAAMNTQDKIGLLYLPCTHCAGQTEFQFGDLSGTGALGCGHCGAALDRALLGRIRLALRTDYVRRQRAAMKGFKTAS